MLIRRLPIGIVLLCMQPLWVGCQVGGGGQVGGGQIGGIQQLGNSVDATPHGSAKPKDSKASTPTLHASTRLVVLDVTVLDHAGRPVTHGLTRNSFHVTEDKLPQTILSFEGPDEHLAGDQKDKLPISIFVLDELNFQYLDTLSDMLFLSDMLQLRDGLRAFLRSQPATLQQETEVLALTRQGLVVVAALSRNRDALLDAVARRQPPLPFSLQQAVEGLQYGQSLSALRVLALENRSVAGRKNVLWLGLGSPAVDASNFYPWQLEKVTAQVHEITNLLIDARICLNVIGPGIKAFTAFGTGADGAGYIRQNLNYAFEDDFGFSGFIRATGGEFHNQNDFDAEMREAVNYGSQFYTLAYHPENRLYDGKFRRIHIVVDPTPTFPAQANPQLLALTKAGYYGLEFNGAKDSNRQAASDLSAVAFTRLDFTGIELKVIHIERHTGSERADFTLEVSPGQLQWQASENGEDSLANLTVAASSFTGHAAQLTSQLKGITLTAPVSDAAQYGKIHATLSVSLLVPRKAQTLRFAVRDQASGRMGTVNLDRALFDQAPVLDTPANPTLRPHPAAAPMLPKQSASSSP